MLYAFNADNIKSRPQPGLEALCPGCGEPVVPKCGQIKIWHWAHKRTSCGWCAGETEWHRQWKSLFPADSVEVKIGNHRADAVGTNGRVWEFQSSTLSPEEIQQREDAYPKLVWVWNVAELYDRLLPYGYDLVRQKGIRLAGVNFQAVPYTCTWERPRERIGFCQKTILLDFGKEHDVLFLVLKSGWGHSLSQLSREITVKGGKYILQGYLLKRSDVTERILEFS